jgi:SAM-dependent methyltransferase
VADREKTLRMNDTDRARAADGSAGDTNYGTIGPTYSSYRQPEPLIAERIMNALGAARSVLNVGAGTGSYEPIDRDVIAVEPSASMRAQRPSCLSPAIDAVAESLPFPDNHFDASLSTFSVHQWTHLEDGLREMRRVTRGPVVILTCDPELVQRFWLNHYAPEVLAVEARRYPSLHRIGDMLGGDVSYHPVPIPLNCRDGFNEAYYGRPEQLLNGPVRLACSAWGFVSAEVVDRAVARLREDLECGRWDQQYGPLRKQPEYDGSLRLIVSRASR